MGSQQLSLYTSSLLQCSGIPSVKDKKAGKAQAAIAASLRLKSSAHACNSGFYTTRQHIDLHNLLILTSVHTCTRQHDYYMLATKHCGHKRLPEHTCSWKGTNAQKLVPCRARVFTLHLSFFVHFCLPASGS